MGFLCFFLNIIVGIVAPLALAFGVDEDDVNDAIDSVEEQLGCNF